MTDLVITPASVVPGSNATIKHVTAGVLTVAIQKPGVTL